MCYRSKKLLLVVIAVAFTLVHSASGSAVHYVTPSQGIQCPEGESMNCLTLSMLAANTSNFFDADMTLIFLSGNHTLQTDLIMANIDKLLILTTNASVTASITCSSGVDLKFINVTQLNISGLEFIGCSSTIELVDQFTLEDAGFHGGDNSSALQLIQTNTNIVRTYFTSNTVGILKKISSVPYAYIDSSDYSYYYYFSLLLAEGQFSYQSFNARAGGALLVTNSKVEISSSHFESNEAEVGGAIFSQMGSNITITNCTFVNNKANCRDQYCSGGALFIGSRCTAVAHNNTFLNNTSEYSGGAVALLRGNFIDYQNAYSGNRALHLGGGIVASNMSTVELVESNISNNTAGGAGGAIFIINGLVIINSSSFHGNEASRYHGGVVYASTSIITVHNSTFDNNEAMYGGVVLAYYLSSITVHNSSFDNNEARQGGVVYATDQSNITVHNSYFDNNEAEWGGFVYATDQSNITVHNSYFDNNEARSYGGVVYASTSNITVQSSYFDNNEARSYGGVVYATSQSNITVHNSSFDNNEAEWGGVVFATDQSNITVHNSSFDNNEAGSIGGVVYANYQSSITVHNSSFDNNEAMYGGVVLAYYLSNITVHNSSFDNNEAMGDGGVVYAIDQSSITVHNSSFDNNEASVGGVVLAYYLSSITVHNSSFDNNEARQGGVVYATNQSKITVHNSSFDNNEAEWGGVVYATNQSNITVHNSYFDNNEAEWGGVVYATNQSNITVHNSSFDNNEAGRGGVVHATDQSNITVHNSSFDNNEAEWGGVAYASTSNITVHNSYFDNNEARSYGGVVYATSQSNITVHNSSFGNNEAEWGGVVYATDQSNITVHNSYFDNNEASRHGGVVYATDQSNITVYNSSFDNNEAGRGGVVHATDQSNITVHNSSFDNNEAEWGGVAYASTSNITVHNSYFDNNEASRGGVVYAASQSNITVHNSSFGNNEARDDGGVVYAIHQSRITVHNSSFDNNEARDDGGVVYATDQSNITVHNSYFDNNKARDGGVVYADQICNINVNSSYFNNNNASSYGGVVYVMQESTISVYSSYFDKNEAGLHGGVMYALSSSNITAHNSNFHNNVASTYGGVMHAEYFSCITLHNSSFENNKASYFGGVMNAFSSNITVRHSSFDNNEADLDGGVAYVNHDSTITLYNSSFNNNKASSNGGVLFAISSSVSFYSSNFSNNEAGTSGGVMFEVETNRGRTTQLIQSEDGVFVNTCTFVNNSAVEGGVLYVHGSFLTDTGSSYHNNMANSNGGVIALNEAGSKMAAISFVNNTAGQLGGVLYLHIQQSHNHMTFERSTFHHNKAFSGGVIAMFASTAELSGHHCNFIGNQATLGGVIHASDSKVDILSQSLLMANNTATENGGAVHLSKSNLTFMSGNSTLFGNAANNGEAIHTSESMEIYCQIKVDANSANNNGGGLYLTMSELKVEGDSFYITRNRAERSGGGLHADNSSIIFEETVHFIDNEAENGAGIGLEKNAILNGISANHSVIDFISNRATRHGGALYVDDKTNPDTCTAFNVQNATSANECFSKSVFLNFLDNSAGESGSNLFGGLLDRCKVHSTHFEESESENITQGLANFLRASNIRESQLDTISSHPVRLCFCRGSHPDCDYQPNTVQVNRGKTFSLQAIAYNQIHSPVNSIIHCSLNSSAGGLDVGQDLQMIHEDCSELTFMLFSPHSQEQLKLSVVGPCNVSGISEQNVMIEITCSCPIGFEISNDNEESCDCICANVLQSYVRTQCDLITQSIIRKDSFWITYFNHSNSSGYVIHPHCPYDYCHTPEKNVSINLTIPNGADTQCASHRSGTLCGRCKSGYSVSLGSSACLHCPPYWPALLVTIVIVFILSGIGLVALLMILNLTVAIGTLNAIIFYANIVAANKSALFSTSEVSFASVFISWLNFDLGFDTCFFNGMDTYIKTWFQLAFPAYIILLVAVIIRLSYHFKSFGNLIGKKDPVATLATLILLSYAKLLQTIITAFSSAILDYPNNSKFSVWLPDATVGYLTFKHAVLFIAAILILLAGLVYTILLFTWQWFLCCPRKRVKWITNIKLSSFFETYHIPYTSKHRYWTGLLLFVRVIIYLVSAFNPSGDPRITLFTTAVIMICLYLYMTMFGIRLYKTWLINVMETITYFNITIVSIATWYMLDSDTKHQNIITNISVAITFIQLLLIISYHAFRYANQKVYTKVSEKPFYKKGINKLTPQKKTKIHLEHGPIPADNDIHQFHELLDMIDHPVNTKDYRVEEKPVEPTKSVVELPKPYLAPPPPPPLEEIKEEDEQQQNLQLNEEDCITVEEHHTASINEKKQRINDASGIEIPECDDCPSSSVVEPPKVYLAPSMPPEEIKEKVKQQRQLNEEDCIMEIEESHTMSINKNKQRVNSYSEIETSECYDIVCPSSSGTEIECDIKKNIPKHHDKNKTVVIVEVHEDSQLAIDNVDTTVTDPTKDTSRQQLPPSDQPE